MNQRRLQILRQVERGEISTAQGARLLSLLEEGRLPEIDSTGSETQRDNGSAGVAAGSVVQDEEMDLGQSDPGAPWRLWKWVPFGLSVLLTVVGSVWIYQGWNAGRFGIGFWLAWFPFFLGVVGMALTWRLRWLHLRIRVSERGERPFKLTLHIPLPFRLAAWAVRTFGHYSPIGDSAQREQIASVLESELSSDAPIVISVDEDDTKVDIVIE